MRFEEFRKRATRKTNGVANNNLSQISLGKTVAKPMTANEIAAQKKQKPNQTDK